MLVDFKANQIATNTTKITKTTIAIIATFLPLLLGASGFAAGVAPVVFSCTSGVSNAIIFILALLNRSLARPTRLRQVILYFFPWYELLLSGSLHSFDEP